MNKTALDIGFGIILRRFQTTLRSQQNILVKPSYSTKFPEPTIQPKIKRGATDILKALAATVSQDINGPAYKYHDDPYLYALSSLEKTTYSLSKESGQKAARWIRDKHANLFDHQPDDPVIEKFLPKIQFDENSDITEEELLNSIKTFQVSESVDLYRLSQSKNIELKDDTLQSLLELLCFYNCEDIMDEDWVEERRIKYNLKMIRLTKSWKDGGVAEEIFSSLKEKGSRPYCAIIKGMCKFGQVDRAWQLYQEALNNNIALETETFNSLIVIAPLLKEDNELRWAQVEEILEKMVVLKVPPNLGTMNAILESLIAMRSWAKVRTIGLQVLSEFKRLNIEPSLASYYCLLKLFYTLKSSNNFFLPRVLDEVETKAFKIQHQNDTMFFFTAMEICRRDLQSWETAQRLNNFLMVGENYKLLGEKIKETIYYRNYFTLAVNSLSLEEMMEFYERYVPHLYSPDREVIEEIIKNIGVYDEISLLPRIWSDCILLEIARGEKIMEMALMIMNKYSLEEADPSLKSQLVNVAWDIWTRIQNQNDGLRNKVEWTGSMLGDCISTLIRCDDPDKAGEIFTEIDENPSIVIGVIPIETLQTSLDILIKNESFKHAQLVLKYAKFNDFQEASAMAKQLSEATGST